MREVKAIKDGRGVGPRPLDTDEKWLTESISLRSPEGRRVVCNTPVLEASNSSVIIDYRFRWKHRPGLPRYGIKLDCAAMIDFPFGATFGHFIHCPIRYVKDIIVQYDLKHSCAF